VRRAEADGIALHEGHTSCDVWPFSFAASIYVARRTGTVRSFALHQRRAVQTG